LVSCQKKGKKEKGRKKGKKGKRKEADRKQELYPNHHAFNNKPTSNIYVISKRQLIYFFHKK
jgi:hypothetical protein